jgi:hypothetical protein
MNDAPERIKYVPIDVQNIYTAVDDALKRAFWAGYEAHKEYEAEQAPQPPEVDWSQAPETATHHAYTGTGRGIWLREPENQDICVAGSTWVGWACADDGDYLPLGIDWRCTLTSRPQEVTA